MSTFGGLKTPYLVPAGVLIVALIALGTWYGLTSGKSGLELRVPGTDRGPGGETGTGTNAVMAGNLVRADGQATNMPGAWPGFRGAARDGQGREAVKLARHWQGSEPKELWAIDAGEGYAGAAVLNGRVYMMDYDQQHRQDALRCLSLAEGREIWRYTYPVSVKRNHGMSRTVPAVTATHAVAIGPKCHVVCVDAATGELRWGWDMVRQYGATVPPWYAGQCPLIESNQVILAPGGKEALLAAVELETGKPIWQSPNPHGWKMTHSSVMPMEVGGELMYVYCADRGVVGVSAMDGRILWEDADWKISIATVPSPLVIEGGRVFLSGGYNAGSLMLQIRKGGKGYEAQTIFKLGPEVFGATQHTPILRDDHIYGVRADGKFACLDLEGKLVWTSDAGQQFGLGSFLMADGLIFAMNDAGLLRMIEAVPAKYAVLGQAQVLKGRESWGPMALAGGRLIARDFTRVVCLDVAEH
jgi:outer membrane protein assembly factor BamB